VSGVWCLVSRLVSVCPGGRRLTFASRPFALTGGCLAAPSRCSDAATQQVGVKMSWRGRAGVRDKLGEIYTDQSRRGKTKSRVLCFCFLLARFWRGFSFFFSLLLPFPFPSSFLPTGFHNPQRNDSSGNDAMSGSPYTRFPSGWHFRRPT